MIAFGENGRTVVKIAMNYDYGGCYVKNASAAVRTCYKRPSYMAKKNQAAVQLGRRGGRATARKLSAAQRKESARKASRARWAKR